MALSEQSVKDFRTRLQDELEQANQELGEIDEQVRSYGDSYDLSEGVDNHPGDESDIVYEQERLMTIRERLSARQQDIQHALTRIDEGKFGTCERCGSPIGEERLDALPFVRYCINCQEIVDREEAEQG